MFKKPTMKTYDLSELISDDKILNAQAWTNHWGNNWNNSWTNGWSNGYGAGWVAGWGAYA